MNSSWKDYNEKLLKTSIELLSKNSKEIFNIEEKRCYPHIRDIVALVIATSRGQSLKIYDYGSNTMPWANIQNKIDAKKINVVIYDPFAEKDYSKDLNFSFPLKIVNKVNFSYISKCDLIIFGSSSQYIENFFELFLKKDFIFPKKILFTDTPFSLNKNLRKDLKVPQLDKSNRAFTVYVRSFFKVNSMLEQIGFKVIFKSALPWVTQDYLSDELSSEIKMANILYER